MNRSIPIVLLLLATLTWPLSSVPAAGCDSAGFQEESCSDIVTCSANAQLSVSASVDEDGSVHGYVSCADRGTSCDGIRSCNAYTGALTSSSGTGSCGGNGYGGYYTVLSVGCGGVQASSPTVHDVIHDALRALPAGSPLPPHVVAAMTPHEGSAAWILVDSGLAAGYACAASLGCRPVTVTCVVDGDAWACKI